MLKLEFSPNTLSQPAKDNVNCDYKPISAPSMGPVTRDMPNNSKWWLISHWHSESSTHHLIISSRPFTTYTIGNSMYSTLSPFFRRPSPQRQQNKDRKGGCWPVTGDNFVSVFFSPFFFSYFTNDLFYIYVASMLYLHLESTRKMRMRSDDENGPKRLDGIVWAGDFFIFLFF